MALRSHDVDPSCQVSLGQEWDGVNPSQYFVGDMDQVSVWSRDQTQDELQELMDFGVAGDEPGLVGYYSFDSGDARDDSGNSNPGTLVGTAAIITP
ncbi:MAG: hypothetical protein KJO07_10845 [Deltaproteobacteria bacterium]|nr:hypothetical protein [Deltaproteobacteria bacterium]